MSAPVETESGLIDGISGRDRSITVYRGIPYAAPPVGPLRWRPPEPPVRAEGVLRAGSFAPMCPQSPRDASRAGIDLPMSEDCLYLNVWAPADAARTGPLPVLVWIYGGGFRAGTGAHPRYDGESLARHGLIVVTFNYRLGAFGFLATPELSAESAQGVSGNYGILDSIALLRWVRDNIAAFGGDPGRVTVAGQSAGAGTVNFLAMSPLAKGLFHRAIAQSHARHSRDPELRYLATSYRTLADAEQAGQTYAREHGARSLADLRALPWQKLVDGRPAFDTGVDSGSTGKPPLFRPVVDGYVLPHGYSGTYTEGRQNDVAYLAGNNLDESGAVPESTFAEYRVRGAAAPNAGAPPIHVTLDAFVAAARHKFGPMAEEFLRLYPAGSDDEAARASNTAVRDNSRISTYLWGTEWTARATRPAYTYFWTHPSPAQGQQPRRASHSSEIEFVFDNLDPGSAAWTDEDREVAATVSAYWANFAATGDPNGPGLPHWPPYAAAVPVVMELGARFAPIPIADPARLDFWKRFFGTQQPW
ncbi:carboxylesterase 2/para-nitrobenzyl esterase [Actinacidiphila yanglinensis]|uniref:Carboxylic ester hydrolase n=1 Tax=Actinacidiphila yanglinensis TaxID=310779 RepID=A0A1H6EH28_9ACTN|nr:carboxylesterase family protein [Actinacidiphila yanglinensis]SEG96115.1 carboxylesterase 2/para-nitrobenzyl esterase [Actinacidiphila yanglinensis]